MGTGVGNAAAACLACGASSVCGVLCSAAANALAEATIREALSMTDGGGGGGSAAAKSGTGGSVLAEAVA